MIGRRKAVVHDFGPGIPKVSVRIKRVRWYSDWTRNVAHAWKEFWLAMFGCQHRWSTIRYGGVTGLREGEWGRWFVNRCDKCGRTEECASWGGEDR
jgi:hypothetical protein